MPPSGPATVRRYTAAEFVGSLYCGLADHSVGKLIDGVLRSDLVVVGKPRFGPRYGTAVSCCCVRRRVRGVGPLPEPEPVRSPPRVRARNPSTGSSHRPSSETSRWPWALPQPRPLDLWDGASPSRRLDRRRYMLII